VLDELEPEYEVGWTGVLEELELLSDDVEELDGVDVDAVEEDEVDDDDAHEEEEDVEATLELELHPVCPQLLP
jgi:hypothetical protein